MREIKFRAWDGEKMIYDMRLSAKEYIEGIRICSWPGHEFVQYTGLKDKNGQEIYEGDIMRYNTVPPTHCAVFWDKGAAQFATEQEEFGVVRRDWVDKRGEVIGNIHENPELLEGE